VAQRRQSVGDENFKRHGSNPGGGAVVAG